MDQHQGPHLALCLVQSALQRQVELGHLLHLAGKGGIARIGGLQGQGQVLSTAMGGIPLMLRNRCTGLGTVKVKTWPRAVGRVQGL